MLGRAHLRRSSTLNGVTTYYAYDGQTLIREMHKNVTTGALYNTATYLQGMRGPEYRRDDTQTELDSQGKTVSKCRWYVYDGLGSVVGEVDVNGSLTSSPKYDVYGLVRSNAGTASSAMGFVGGLGHLSEAGTGLIYMKARYYDPALGRFSSEDPSYNGINWFVYCDNNPVNEVDRSGKIGEGLVGAIISALIDSGMSFSGTGKLAGMTNDAAVDFIEEKIHQLKSAAATNTEMAGEYLAMSTRNKIAGDEDGAALFMGLANQQSRGAAEKVVAMLMLNQVADMLVAEQF